MGPNVGGMATAGTVKVAQLPTRSNSVTTSRTETNEGMQAQLDKSARKAVQDQKDADLAKYNASQAAQTRAATAAARRAATQIAEATAAAAAAAAKRAATDAVKEKSQVEKKHQKEETARLKKAADKAEEAVKELIKAEIATQKELDDEMAIQIEKEEEAQRAAKAEEELNQSSQGAEKSAKQIINAAMANDDGQDVDVVREIINEVANEEVKETKTTNKATAVITTTIEQTIVSQQTDSIEEVMQAYGEAEDRLLVNDDYEGDWTIGYPEEEDEVVVSPDPTAEEVYNENRRIRRACTLTMSETKSPIAAAHAGTGTYPVRERGGYKDEILRIDTQETLRIIANENAIVRRLGG